MISRRTIFTLLLLLPFATAQADDIASGHKKNRSRHRGSTQSQHAAQPSETTKQIQSATKKSASAKQSHQSPQRSAAKEKLAKRAVDAIPEKPISPSLYDRRTAQTPSASFLPFFGPKADGIRYDSRMLHAAKIAEDRARQHSIRRCWRYVKQALVAADVVDTYPQTTYAKQAGDELIRQHGFRRLTISDPFKAPVGAVLVYGGRGAGHVEIRTKGGFVSDFESPTPSKRPLLGVFVKPS